ncbi:GntR family transcriptional regulator [Pseudonocardia acaciae]|uniref:GntR family transcriptional regulator n=1 Tax=Pseudonocardia acaciae TaxID=551276 RepID=UPI00068826DA|nr:GntR family transcriptional regulator [Pseudonocardia acaciae]
MPLESLQRQSLGVQAVDTLRELVLTGEIAPGERVNEVEFARGLGISRGPVREAIRQLTSEGLLVYSAHRGTYVRHADRAEVRALFELRSALECAAARMAATRRTDADLARMRDVNAASRQSFEAGRRFPYRLDLAFHQALLESAASPLIAEQVRLAQQQVVLLRSRDTVAPAHTHASMDDHDRLIEAIAARDETLAAVIMQEHLDRVLAQMLAAMPPDAERME